MKVKSFTSTVLLCAALFALSGCAEKAENSARTTEVKDFKGGAFGSAFLCVGK